MTLLDRARQAGATARLKGLSRFNNPFEADYEMPPETGESLDHWFAKFEAWRTGWERTVLEAPKSSSPALDHEDRHVGCR